VTKRDYCISELVETEKNYIEALMMIINVRLCRFTYQSYHFSAISGNLEMSGNSAKVGEKPKVGEKSGKG